MVPAVPWKVKRSVSVGGSMVSATVAS